jgi:glucokinase
VPRATLPAVHERYLAIDLGASRLAAGVVGADGAVLVRDRVATPARHVWPTLVRLIRRVLAASAPLDGPPTACGVSCPGPIDRDTGTFTPAQVSSWAGFPLRTELESVTGLPVSIELPGRALALGERWCGAAEGVDDVVAISVGDVVDAGIVSGGRLLDGRFGNVGQVGHMLVEPDGRPCTCGAYGCLDAYASASAIESDTNRPLARTPAAIVDRTGIMLARAIASVSAMVEPRLVLVAGSVPAVFGEPLFAALHRELEQRVRLPHLAAVDVVALHGATGGPLVAAAAAARAARTS